MNMDEIVREYGKASLSPDSDVVVGSYQTWEITYTVGNLGMDDGSTLKIASNMTSDWGTPQFDHPSEPNYVTVETTGDATVEASFDPEGHERPLKHTISVDIFDGSLDEGEEVIITIGDTDGGSLGHRAQTFPETDFELGVLVDPFGTNEFVELPEKLLFDVVSGAPTSITAVVDSNAEPDERVDLSVRVEDYWGNTATEYAADLQASVQENQSDRSVSLEARNGTAHGQIEFNDPGIYRLFVTDDDGLETTTNPVVIGEDAGSRTYWGDIHGQSGETVGTGTISEYFEFGRENAFLDYISHCGNDFQITDDFWSEIKDIVREFNEPGEYVTFLCYEWSANTSRGGDHNVYFKNTDQEIYRSSNWQVEDGFEKHEGLHPVADLYEYYEDRDDVMIIPHQGGRPATLDAFDPNISPFVETLSVWGVFEWFGKEALEEGYPVGFVAGSDDHTGRPGATYPTNQEDFNIKGGLMATKAESLSRDSLWEAFMHRQVYATTGARILLDVDLSGASMGESVSVDGPSDIDVKVHGTAPIQRIELFSTEGRVDVRDFTDGDDLIEIEWTGSRGRIRHKVTDWSGGVSISQGRIDEVEEFGFDHPEQGIIQQTDTSVHWRGGTSGNYQGIQLDVSIPEDATLRFGANDISVEQSIDDLGEERTIGVGEMNQELTVRRVGVADAKDVECSSAALNHPLGNRTGSESLRPTVRWLGVPRSSWTRRNISNESVSFFSFGLSAV